MLILLVFLGTLLEGELSMLILGSVHFSRGGSFVLFVCAAWLGAYLGDWFWFVRGQNQQDQPASNPFWKRWLKRWLHKMEEFRPLVNRFPLFSLTFLRYQMYLRAWGCSYLGRTGFARPQFLRLNALACLFWALGISLIAYYVAQLYQSIQGLLDEILSRNI
ncbi:MAG: hypothetical protein H6510_05755 [Acidobacteria bacterium]|nr:hypothetical protein [Acidobacteriota bacterium]MCB9397298.1 hypothetical protein [Acidobacteriota bacterium]